MHEPRVESMPDIHQGDKVYVDGKDFHGERDYALIVEYGYNNLNFVPSTEPDFR